MNRSYKIAFAGIIILAATLRSINLNQPLWPDEALYAQTAKNIVLNGTFTFDGSPWTLQPPLFIFVLASLYATLGSYEVVARMASPILATIGIIGVFYLGKSLYSEKAGLLAAFFLAISPRHWFFSRMIIADITLSTLIIFTLLSFYQGYEYNDKRYLLLSSLFIGATTIAKKIGIVVYPILISYLLLREKSLKWLTDRRIWAIFFLSVLFQAPWYIRNYLLFRDPLIDSQKWISGVSSLTKFSLFSTTSIENLIMLTVPILLLSGIGIYFSIKEKRKEGLLIAAPLLAFLYIHSFLGEYEIRRYMISIIPFFSIFAAYGILRIPKIGRIGLVIILLFTAEINLLEGSMIIGLNKWKYEGYAEAGHWIRDNTPEASLIFTNSRQIWYYSDRKCSYFPTAEDNFWNAVANRNNTYIVISNWPTALKTPQYVYQLPKRYPERFHLLISVNGKTPKIEIYRINYAKRTANHLQKS